MADAADIQFVLDEIDGTDENAWSEEEIADRLDEGSIPARVVARYWRKRANAVINLVNVSESGSSRAMDSLYPRFNALANEWDAKAKEIENPVTPETAVRGRLGSFPIRRV